MLAALLAVTASVAYGSSDVAAGLASRRATPLAVAWWTHVLGAAVVLALATALAGPPTRDGLLLGMAAGAVLTVGLLLYYGALSRGQISLITPLAASGVVVPVLVGLAHGEHLGPVSWAGLVLAAAGVLVVTRRGSNDASPSAPRSRPGGPRKPDQPAGRLPPAPTALLAALAFGTSLVLIDAGGSAGTSPLWAAAGLQAGGLAALVPVVVAGPARGVALPPGAVPLVVVTGLLITGADVSLAAAFAAGDLAVVSVLASLDAVVSVGLAQLLLRERLGRSQTAGIVAALSGALILASG